MTIDLASPPQRAHTLLIAPLWMTMTATSLCVVGLLYYGAATADGDYASRTVWGLLLANGLLAAGRLSWLVGRGQPRVFELMYWTFVFVFLVLAPTVQFGSDTYPSTTPDLAKPLNVTALEIVLVGNLAVLVGVLATRPQRLTVAAFRVDERRVMILTAFAVLANLYYVAKVGPSTLLSSRQELNAAVRAAWPLSTTAALIQGLATLPLLVSTGALMQVRRQRLSRGEQAPGPLIALTMAMLFVTVNPLSSPRYYFGTVLLGLAAMFGAYATAARVRRSTVLFLAALVLLFPAADAFRFTQQSDVGKGGVVAALTTGDFDAIDQINNTARYVQERGTADGRQALGPALFWVPRGIWPDKPMDTGVLVAQYRGYDFTNLSAPLWAEWYINGSWLLLAVGMAGVGLLLRRGDQTITAAGEAAERPPILLTVLPFYLIILLRGSLLQASALLAVLVCSGLWVMRRSADIHGTADL